MLKSIIFLILISTVQFSLASFEMSSKLTHLNQEKLESIEIIKRNLTDVQKRLKNEELILSNEKDPKRKLVLEADIKKTKDRYNKLKLSLISIITDIKMDDIQKDELNKKRDYFQEAQELLGPAFDTIQRISERPRKIEALRKELQINREKLAVTQMALKNIDIIKTSDEFNSLLPDIDSFLSDATYNVNDLVQEFQLKIDRLERELKELTKDDQTVFGAATHLLRDFFSNKGKHLVISFSFFLFTLWSLTVLKNKLILKIIAKSKVEWIYKPISALYGFFTFTTALMVGIFSLYVMGDWVLVTITILIISAILWGSKSYIHKYLAEGRLILNLGTIKEGELVIFRGIPWKVKTINFVTIFENEFLDSCIIRIEISQIFHMHSRKILSNEQWFPSRSGDWVMLSDGTFGQVKLQTVEQIIIELLGAQRKYLTTTEYLNLKPINLSHGFNLDLVWSLDYDRMNVILDEDLPKIKERLVNYRWKKVAPTNVSIDFHSAGVNSLNIYVIASFSKEAAAFKLDLERELQGAMLKISNDLKLQIPFPQLVVHSKENHHHFS